MLPSLFSHRISFRLLIPITAFLFAAVAGISVAAWLDAPGAPPNYGTVGCSPQPCSQDDFKPMNLSAAPQTKRAGATFEGDVISNQFLDRQNNAYFLDPASPILAGTLSGALNISQTTPGAKLVVNNPSTVTKTGVSGDAIYAYADSANAALSAEQGNPAGYAVYASGGINYFQGNVGIGTTAPTQKLDVAGNIVIPNNGWYYSKDTAGTLRNLLSMTSANDTELWSGPSGYTLFKDTSGAERMRITNTGNVGIGTTTPTNARLHVQSTGTDGIRISGGAPTLWFEDMDSGGKTYAWINSAISNGNFGLWDNSIGDYRLYVNNTGNVGIGTNSPQAKLEVAGDIYFPTGRTFYNTNWGGGNLINCSAGASDYLNPSSNPACTCQTGTVIHSGNTCTFNSWAHGGNNFYACVYSCTITSSAIPEYYSALRLWQQSGSPTGFYK